MSMQQISSPPQASAEIVVNENFETLDHQSVYGKAHATTSGLTWGYYGGRWGGFAVAAGTLTLTASQTNYIVVQRSDGAISVSTASTNWDNADDYARVYKLTTSASAVTATEDHRAGPGGAHGGGGSSIGASRNVVTALSSSSGAVTIDASLGDYFKLTLTENVSTITLSGVPAGASLIVQITQDATPRTVAWPASFTWVGAAGAVSTAAGAVDLLAITTLDGGTTWRATLGEGFA